MLSTLLSMLAAFALLSVAFVPLERAFAARPGQRVFRSQLATDLCFFAGQYFPLAALTTACLVAAHGFVTTFLPLGELWQATRSLPLWGQLVLALVLGDLAIYWFHRACHHFPLLWRFHAVHHSTLELDWVAAHREHPLDGLFTQLLLNLPGMVLGVDFVVFGPMVVFRGMWAIFIHSNVRLPLGPLRWLLGAPELHHWHHARVESTQHNFANLAPYLDVLFGTYHCPQKGERYPLGIPGDEPRGYLAHLVEPFGLRWPRAARQKSPTVV